jgi:F-type H+-transporting ATPase subunit delta
MQNPRLAGRYAKSILDLAKETNQLDVVYNDMQTLHTICKGNKDFVAVLKSPVIKPDKKQVIINAVLQSRVGILTTTFSNLLIIKGREKILSEIVTAFIDQYKVLNNIQVVTLLTAAEVSAETLATIKQKVSGSLPGKTIEIVTKVKPELIGGFVIEVGDKRVDASIAYDLKEVSKQFMNNDFIFNLK